MPSSPPKRFPTKRAVLLQFLLVAALTVVVRLPFLLHGARFFDADEAVEGLMARHLLQGEFPVYLWGQHYKGVPEVYLAGLFFAVAGPGVIALKAATLACFAAFTSLQFLLIRRLFSGRIAWLTTALVLAGPPSLVLWSLSANAEIVLTLLAGTIAGLGLERWRQTGSRGGLVAAAAAVGFGLWVQQYIVYYLVAAAITWLLTLPAAGSRVRMFFGARELPIPARVALGMVLAIALGYVILGVVAFCTGGFDVEVADLVIGLKNPQKLWRIGAAIGMLYGAGRTAGWLATTRAGRAGRSSALYALLGCAAGYAPALLGRFQGRGGAPISRMDIHGLGTATGAIVSRIAPMVLGFRGPGTEWLGVPGWLVAVIGLTACVSCASLFAHPSRPGDRPTPFFHVFLVTTPALFLMSGAFVDAQSYRYLMPLYAALPVVLALGVSVASRWHVVAGAALFLLLFGTFGAQQASWYEHLEPDAESPAILDCLEASHVRGAFADYWHSYKLTFLADERVIVAPATGVDRYPPFTAFVRALARTETGAAGKPCAAILVQ